jgi:F-type H+-transporting ATPase subunit delta
MQNPRLAARYAKSLLDIAQEQNAVEPVLNDIKLILQICESNTDFVSMLRSPIIKADKKVAIINAILGSKIEKVTAAFINLIINKGREYFMPEIAAAYVSQYKAFKDIYSVTLTTAIPLSSEMTQAITQKITAALAGKTIDLESIVDPDIIGGFTLTVGDKEFDASIKRDLADIKNQFTKNLYIADI